jgi:tRNA-Thr(GGU) m(6)t(6)A37 methyltransferase TsaA
MKIEMTPIGFVRTQAESIPRHWTLSDVEGKLIIHDKYRDGLKDISSGQRISVIFCFHKSPAFRLEQLIQKPLHIVKPTGVFNLCSPHRPNPIGYSVLTVLSVQGSVLTVKGLDMIDGTPILDIKPYVTNSKDADQK